MLVQETSTIYFLCLLLLAVVYFPIVSSRGERGVSETFLPNGLHNPTGLDFQDSVTGLGEM